VTHCIVPVHRRAKVTYCCCVNTLHSRI